MIAGASILMTISHPGLFFPAISSRRNKRLAKERALASPEAAVQEDEILEKTFP